MTEWFSFYHEQTGAIWNRRYKGPELEANTPPGYAPIPGRYDHNTQRVNVLTKEVEPIA